MRINLGAGLVSPDGWVNLDAKPSSEAVSYGDILNGIPYEDVDLVVTNHVLHMFTWDELDIALRNVHKVLKPGGVFRVIDMDPIKAFNNYLAKNKDKLIIPDDVEPSLDGKFCKYLTWYSTRRSICTSTFMMELLLRAGFTNARPGNFGQCELDSREHESFIVEGIK